MKHHMLVLGALLILTNEAAADYLLIKIDYDLIDFGVLRTEFFDKKPLDKTPDKTDKADKKPVVKTGANWIYGILKYDKEDLKKLEPKEEKIKIDPKNPDKKPPGPAILPRWELSVGEQKSAKWLFPMLPPQSSILPGLIVKNVNIKEYVPTRTLREEYLDKKQKAGSDEKKLFDLALWTLQHGLTRDRGGKAKEGKEFQETMEALREVSVGHKAVQKYDEYRKAMDNPKLDEPQMSEALRKELENHAKFPSEQGHFVIYWKDSKNGITEDQAKRRLARFEEVYSNFFYWWALQENMDNKLLPRVPKHRLAVLVESPEEFTKRLNDMGQAKLDPLSDRLLPPVQQTRLDDLLIRKKDKLSIEEEAVLKGLLDRVDQQQPSGITVRRENLCVLSALPVTKLYEKLKQNMDEIVRVRRFQDELVSGAVWNHDDDNVWFRDPKTKKKIMQRPDVAASQTLAVLLDTMEDEAEWRTISREGTRQLLGASGFLARNVSTPEWIQSGLVGFFEIRHPHLHLGFGLPRADYLGVFNAFHPKTDAVLTDLVTNRYFRPKKDRFDRTNLAMGQAASWCLIYYLAVERKMDYLSDYAKQLNGLPRHMMFHPDTTLKTCFDLGFNLNYALDQRKLKTDEWFKHMDRQVSIENREMIEFFAPAK